MPKEKLIPLGIPVSEVCRREISKESAREELGLSNDKKYILAAGGSMGAGDMKKMVESLLKSTDDEELIVICGSNKRLKSSLKKLSEKKRERIFSDTQSR